MSMSRLQFIRREWRMKYSRWGLVGAERKVVTAWELHRSPPAWPGYTLRRAFSRTRIRNIKHRHTYRARTKVI